VCLVRISEKWNHIQHPYPPSVYFNPIPKDDPSLITFSTCSLLLRTFGPFIIIDRLPNDSLTSKQDRTSQRVVLQGLDGTIYCLHPSLFCSLFTIIISGAAGGEVGRSMQAVHGAHDDRENFLELLNSRTLAPELFAEPPACDYLKKMEYSSGGDSGWLADHQNLTFAAALEKHLEAGYGGALAHQHQHAANLSDLVSNWSIAPPIPCHLGDSHHRAGSGAEVPCDNNAVGHGAKAGFFLDSGGLNKHEMGGHNASMLQHDTAGGSNAAGQEFLTPAMGYSSMLGLGNHRMYGAVDVPSWGNNAGTARRLTDFISFGAAQGKPEPLAVPAKTAAEFKKQGQAISSPVRVMEARLYSCNRKCT
jgi:hypothetical protein